MLCVTIYKIPNEFLFTSFRQYFTLPIFLMLMYCPSYFYVSKGGGLGTAKYYPIISLGKYWDNISLLIMIWSWCYVGSSVVVLCLHVSCDHVNIMTWSQVSGYTAVRRIISLCLTLNIKWWKMELHTLFRNMSLRHPWFYFVPSWRKEQKITLGATWDILRHWCVQGVFF